jgi:hypothetical protein
LSLYDSTGIGSQSRASHVSALSPQQRLVFSSGQSGMHQIPWIHQYFAALHLAELLDVDTEEAGLLRRSGEHITDIHVIQCSKEI